MISISLSIILMKTTRSDVFFIILLLIKNWTIFSGWNETTDSINLLTGSYSFSLIEAHIHREIKSIHRDEYEWWFTN